MTRECPYCGYVMSQREADEQGLCNDCYGGAYNGPDEPVSFGKQEPLTEGPTGIAALRSGRYA